MPQPPLPCFEGAAAVIPPVRIEHPRPPRNHSAVIPAAEPWAMARVNLPRPVKVSSSRARQRSGTIPVMRGAARRFLAGSSSPTRWGRLKKCSPPAILVVWLGKNPRLKSSEQTPLQKHSRRGQVSRQSGGMADALDSKSCVRKGVWVRLPPLVLASRLDVKRMLKRLSSNRGLFSCARGKPGEADGEVFVLGMRERSGQPRVGISGWCQLSCGESQTKLRV